MKKLLTLIAMALLLPIGTYAATKIMGKQVATIDRMYQFVKSKNANFDREIAVQMYKMGEKYGVRGDIALCQSCVETGWFKYTGGTAVTPDDHNYCGLGVTQKGKKGCQFSTVAQGCEAQIQHLFAYACKDALPYAQVDPRFKYVTRGCATTWEALGGKWASSTSYGTNILSIYNQMMNFTVANPTLKASKTTLNFTVEKGKVSAAQNVTITGSNLSSKIVYNANSKMASVSTSGWDEYTGGTMSIKVDATSKAAGTYTDVYVAVQSGSGSDLKRVEIRLSITVTEPASAPSLSATPSSLTLSATRGKANPTATISVKGSNLTGDISYNSSSSTFTVTPASGWNARTGGNLIVAMDASKSAGNYNGYVAIAGGGASRVQVNVSGTITEPAATPTLNVTPSSLSLSCTQGDANPTATVTVSAANLTSGLIYDINGNGFTVTPQSGWNGSTGGRLTVALDASKAAGTYNATLIVKGGGVTTRNITLTGTIKDKGTTPDPTPSTELNLKEVWNLSTTAGTATDWSGKIRNFDYCDGYLYAIYNNSEVLVLDARTGQKVGTLAKGSVVSGGTLALCDVRCFEGKIYACNLAASGKELRIYSWDNKDAQPQLVYNTTDLQGAARLGDCMEIVGTEDSMWIAFCNDDGTTTRIVEYHRLNGSSWTAKCTNATVNGARLGSGFSSRVYPTGEGYWIDGQSILPTFCNLGGVKQYALTGESVAQGNAWKEFTFGGKKYMLVATYLNKSATSVADGIMRLYDVTDGYDKAKAMGDYPANGLGATRNTSFTGGIEYNVASCQGVEAWVLTTNQGLAYYSSCTTTPTDPDPDPDPDPEPGKPTTLPDKFATDWEYSSTQGTSTSYMNPSNVNTRNMVLNGDNLYVLQRESSDANIRIVDAATGVQKGTLDNGDIASDTYRYFSVANLSGTIVACNLAFGATSTLKVYAWTGDNATPTTILSTTNHGARAGDLMCASGTINNGKLYFASNSGYAGKVYVYTVTNGTANATPQVITLKDASGKDFDLGGGFAVIEIRVDEQGRILASGKGGATALFKADGTHIESMANAAVGGNICGSSCQMFGYGDFTLAASVTYATGVKGGRLNLINATNGLSKATLIHEYPALSSSSGTSNSTFVSTAIARVSGAKIDLWVLVPGQGVAKYTAVSTSGLTSVSDLAEDADQMTIALEGRTIRVLGAEKAAIAVYTTTGALVTSADADAVDASSLTSGIYVVTAVSADGRRAAARVLVR